VISFELIFKPDCRQASSSNFQIILVTTLRQAYPSTSSG